MSNLTKECIDAIEDFTSSQGNLFFRKGCKLGATEALTNPAIYQAAGLIKADDVLPESFKKEAVNTILVNALRFLNDEQLSHLLKAICQRNTNATWAAGLMTVDEALEFAEWLPKQLGLAYSIEHKSWFSNYFSNKVTTPDLLTIFRQQAKN